MVRFVVMGAGKASRMGQDKLAMPWGNTTILGHVLRTTICSVNRLNLEENVKNLLTNREAKPKRNTGSEYEIIVVARKPMTEFLLEDKDTSHEKAEVAYVPQAGSLRWIHVPSPQPLADTIRIGLSELSESVHGISFIPGDQVGLNPNVLVELTTFFLDRTPDFLVPQAGEIAGSPVFFHRSYLPDLMSLQGEQGGRKVLEKYRERWTMYPVEEEFFGDIDTMEEYKAYQKKYITD